MPPTRRSRTSGGPALKGAQSTLSFNSSKISKTTSKEKAYTLPEKAIIDVGHVTSEPAVIQQAKVEIKSLKSAEEERANQVTEAQIKKYWRECEKARTAPRVHQDALDMAEKILRLFDMSSQYGPCIGVARMKRWVRANKLGLAPPIEVLAVLLKEEKKGNSGIERAYVDELMNSKANPAELH